MVNKEKSHYLFSKLFLLIYVISQFTLAFQAEYSKIPKLLSIVLAIVFLVECLVEKNSRFVFPYPLLFAFLFLFILTFSSLFIIDDDKILIVFIQVIVLFTVIINMIKITGNVWPVILGVIIGTIILNFQVWVFLGNTFYLQGQRIPSEFINANRYSMNLCISILFSIYTIFILRRRNMHKFLKRSTIFFLFINLFFNSYLIITVSGSRKGMIALFLIIIALVTFLWKKSNISLKVIYILMIPLAFILILNSIEDTVGFQRLTNLDKSTSVRMNMINEGFELWTEKPLLGWGINQFKNVTGYSAYSHNNYIELLANNGLLGFLAYYAIFFSIFLMIIHLYNKIKKDDRFILFWCSISLIILLFWDIGLVSYYSSSNWLILALVVGILVSKKESLKKDTSYHISTVK